MAGVDLTRFDFHAQRFMHSDNVRAMTLEEIGMYILLLTESWLTGKDASLPDSMEVFKTISRGKDVPKLVIDMFPVVETRWGARRRNPTLYCEWVEAVKRSDDGRMAVEKRWEKQRNVTPSYERNTPVYTESIPKPSQADSNQTNPSQKDMAGPCSFRNISTHYASFMGIGHSHSKKHVEKYHQACQKYGEDRVLEIFDEWAQSADWLRDKRDANGLNLFWKPLEDMIAGQQLAIQRVHKIPGKVPELSTFDPFAPVIDPDALTPEQELENRYKI